MDITPNSVSLNVKIDGHKPGHKIDKERKNVQNNSESGRATNVQVSPMARNFSKALKMLDQEEEARPEMVEKGREILKNWQPPTDKQVEHILSELLHEV